MKLTFILFTFLFLNQSSQADEMENLMKSLDSLPETGTVIPDCFPEDPFESVVKLTPILPKKEEGPRPYLQERPRDNTCTRKQFSSAENGEDAGFRTISHFPCKVRERVFIREFSSLGMIIMTLIFSLKMAQSLVLISI